MVRSNDETVNTHTGSEWQELNSQRRLYLLTAFCNFSLPYKNPGTDVAEWVRVNGNKMTVIKPRTIISEGKISHLWTYGKIGRLLLIWISTQVMLHKADGTLTLVLPRSLNQLMREIGIERQGGKPSGNDYARYRSAIRAIAGLHATVSTMTGDDGEGGEEGNNFIIADSFDIYWTATTISNNSTIKLSKTTFDLIKKHSTPLDAAAVMMLTSTNPITKGRSRGQDLDLYCWLSARNYALIHSGSWQTAPITWKQLSGQFGNTYSRTKDFVQWFKKSLKTVQMVWPELNVEIIDGQGIILHRSKRSVSPKRKPTGK
jgi:hypothetical protein